MYKGDPKEFVRRCIAADKLRKKRPEKEGDRKAEGKAVAKE